MTNVKTDKRYLDIKAKISKLEKNVSDIKETISQKAAELKQLAKSKKEFKVSRTLGDLTHQLFQKQEKTLKEKAETLTHETHDLESDQGRPRLCERAHQARQVHPRPSLQHVGRARGNDPGRGRGSRRAW